MFYESSAALDLVHAGLIGFWSVFSLTAILSGCFPYHTSFKMRESKSCLQRKRVCAKYSF